MTNSRVSHPRTDASGATLFMPGRKAPGEPGSRSRWTLSPELRQQITRRLRLIAITYSAAFFFADVVPAFLFRQTERMQSPFQWVPTLVSIVAGLVMAAVVSSSRLSWQTKLHLGLAFEVVGSYGIAIAQYFFPPELRSQPLVVHVLSPSWVAVWMLLFSIVVPAPPRKTLLALIASASAPPVVIWNSLHRAGLGDIFPFPMLLVHHVLPYAICVAMAYAGARVVYRLGADVSRAQELGSYRLIERLSSGGMGEVWRATHQFLARPAAIKFIRPVAGVQPGEEAMLHRRFELEARATASLTSAHTVDLYDFGITDDGAFYYVMELLDGVDCEELVQRFGALPPARVVHLLEQVCESLDEAHTKGLIHRDVKPANVYVCRSGNRVDFVKVLDFGLVTHGRSPRADDIRLTLPDQAVGTPRFMAPEVALGKEIDGRADLYGLGCVAYWLVTARPVFEGASPLEVVSKHLHERPDPPSRHSPHGLPDELDALILACLEKEPERRPVTARELRRRLNKVPLAESWGDGQAESWWAEHLAAPTTAAANFVSQP